MIVLGEKWSRKLVEMAQHVSTWSKDDSTKVGAIITTLDGKPVSWGYNGFPMNVSEWPERLIRPEKYIWTSHAEQNAMDLSSRADLTGCVMFVTFFPCTTCSRSIIQRGIKNLVVDQKGHPDLVPDRWKDDMAKSMIMLTEAGVSIIFV